MRPSLQFLGTTLLLVWGSTVVAGCHRAQPRALQNGAVATSPGESSVPEHDNAWGRRAAVVNVDPGNSITKRRSESHFTPRTSRASVDSHSSSLLVQVAALNHLVSIHKPLVEQQLRELGLDVVGTKHRKLRSPNSFNVLVEDVTYVEEVERKHPWEPVVYTLMIEWRSASRAGEVRRTRRDRQGDPVVSW